MKRLILVSLWVCSAIALFGYGFSSKRVQAQDRVPLDKAVQTKDTAPMKDLMQLKLQQGFQDSVLPFLKSNCLGCHGLEKQEGKLGLATFLSVVDVSNAHTIWSTVLDRLSAGDMPPEDAPRQPTVQQRREIIEWIKDLRKYDADRNAGDPGKVVPRRLSNSEYNYSIRDLTGIDIRPTDEFPIDPANESGFDNSGESLSMTPALLNKYLAAARKVSEHVVLKPHGFDFSAFPVNSDPDRDKYSVRRIVDFYQRQPVNLADYFQAAWRFKYRDKLADQSVSLDDVARQSKLSPKYLSLVWTLLVDEQDNFGPIAHMRLRWNSLPGPNQEAPLDTTKQVHAQCEQMRDWVMQLRPKLRTEFKNLAVRGMHAGSQTLVTWKNQQYASNRRTLNRDALIIQKEETVDADSADAVKANDTAAKADSDLVIPLDSELQKKHIAAFERFCSVFPDTFFVSERGRVYLNRSQREVEQEKGRLLSAGFHSMMGYFRDDVPLYELILNADQQKELDLLWQELDFITSAPTRQHTGFVWFERTDSRFMISEEFDFARAEDKDVTSEEKIQKLSDVYLAKAIEAGGQGAALDAIRDHFKNVNIRVRWVEQARQTSKGSHLFALIDFAKRAFRRPLSETERLDLIQFYNLMSKQDGVTHEDAVRDTVVSILMSPKFCFRIDVSEESGEKVPLTDFSIASRLSYFLWSSLPDDELLTHAAAGDLHRPEILLAQTKRMLKDDRIRGLATEFGGNWLDFRRFENHNSVDRARFPSFDNALRKAMYEEPIRFMVDLFQRDGSALDFLFANHTFVNATLAAHYGLPIPSGEDWIRVDDASSVERGGLIPMSVFMTANSPGLRTSPVKRGYWVVRRLLGERIPAPPPNVPDLPDNEEKLGQLTLREALALHREDASCAVCHNRFDSFGLVFEGFGPIGERREKDLGGRKVDTKAIFPGGSERIGLEGLKTYIRDQRQTDFIDNLCRKMLSYGLGRSLQLSDETTLATMRQAMADDQYRFGGLIETIVTSNQFLMMRGRDHSNYAGIEQKTEKVDP